MTPRSLALAAACLLFRQDRWPAPSGADDGRLAGRLSLLGSLCVAAGGSYNENGDPEPPEEAAAAEVLTCTCQLLAAGLEGAEDAAAALDPTAAERRLDEMRPLTTAESVDIQLLLARVHGVHPPV